jgi:ribonucleoside-triphosphate reductase
MGFIGLAEALTVLLGKHHGESEYAQEVGLGIVKFMRQRTDEATKKYGLNFSTFATPSESACYTLLKLARERFGIVKGATDKEYFTNSSHLPVGYVCTMQHKIDIEAPYHKLCNAGHIMYVEMLCSPHNNLDAVELIVNYMADHDAAYGGVNWVHAFCNTCNYQGDFKDECPKCGGRDIKVTAIITGYLSEINRFNAGKIAELRDRVAHE